MVVESSLEDPERKRLLAQYAEIATLAGGLAHEIKNPLSTIGINLELMAEEIAESELPRARLLLKKIQTIQQECGHLEEILNAFLQFARVGQMELVRADLNQLLREFIDFYQPQAKDHGIDVSPHLDPDIPETPLDRSLMRQVLMNLALNAQHAMPEGGLLELQTSVRDGRVCLDFIDNGTGMNERVLSKMFQAFFSTKSEGSGLGLATVRKIVEAHHGTISCESELGRGTRFSISLPAAR